MPSHTRNARQDGHGLTLTAKCAVCGQAIPGLESRNFPRQVKLDLHQHHRLRAWCAGSGSIMPLRGCFT